jgi:hypothetical protein
MLIPLAVLLTRGDGDEGDAADPLVLPRALNDAKRGISLRWPDGWTLARPKGRVELTSSDRTTAMLIAATRPSSGPLAAQEYKDVISELKRVYKKPKVALTRDSKPLSGLPTASAIVRGVNRKGVQQVISVIVAKGRRHVYLIEIVAPQGGGRLGDAALISRSLRLTN